MFGNCSGTKKEYKPAPKFLPKGLYLSENTYIEVLNEKLPNWICPGKAEWVGCEDDIYWRYEIIKIYSRSDNGVTK